MPLSLKRHAALQTAELAQRDHEDRLNAATEVLSAAREERAGAKGARGKPGTAPCRNGPDFRRKI